jgi:hypothetical protein
MTALFARPGPLAEGLFFGRVSCSYAKRRMIGQFARGVIAAIAPFTSARDQLQSSAV